MQRRLLTLLLLTLFTMLAAQARADTDADALNEVLACNAEAPGNTVVRNVEQYVVLAEDVFSAH